jgi:hypothetical protein
MKRWTILFMVLLLTCMVAVTSAQAGEKSRHRWQGIAIGAATVLFLDQMAHRSYAVPQGTYYAPPSVYPSRSYYGYSYYRYGYSPYSRYGHDRGHYLHNRGYGYGHSHFRHAPLHRDRFRHRDGRRCR